MANKDILDKIQKLLALSKSTNPSEASIALNRAQKLMAEHNISSQDISLNSIDSQKYELKSYFRSKILIGTLASIICKAFGVDYFFNYVNSKPRGVTFVGNKDRMEIAIYTVTILQRQLEIERATYKKEHEPELKKRIDKAIAEHNATVKALLNHPIFNSAHDIMFDIFSDEDEIEKRITKKVKYAFNKELNLFLEGWLCSVNKKVIEFALSDNEAALISTYMKKNFNLTSTHSRKRNLSTAEIEAFKTGQIRGKDGFNLYSAVNGSEGCRLTFKEE
ncbi:Protein of uncharacterised function (DUF2786) [Anaerobiospirillum thomasii]|uniref:DUF2786 domain-containing protein n=1 Tax=Anaerobiospirillum thomasii TaxID=179995 RepID=UPI000D965151|nr:DUF2786 domain-containing protein [Anaerobiospirillum thomasii]SPT68080.1 Protein of uncharacterised function (DUF2786) [Anaerobiospirillum thomasii]